MLVGRDPELAMIGGLLARAGEQTPFVLGVSGPVGSGRSSIADLTRRLASDLGSTVLAARGSLDDADVAFGGLLTLLRPLDKHLDELAGDLVGPLRAALAMRRDRVDVLDVRLALLRVLTVAAETRQVTVVIDDADRLDPGSVDALRFALSRLGVDRVGAVATSLDGSSPFDTVATHRVRLGPLRLDALVEIVADIGCVPTVAATCAEWSDGNPLAAIELARSLTEDERSGRAPLPAVPRPTTRVVEALQRELDARSACAQRALVVVAADRSGSVPVVLAALAALGENGDGLDEAEACGLVILDGDDVRFRQPLLRPLSYRLVAASSRRAAHRALATVLVAPHQAAERAFQLVASCAGPDAAAADALELVAADAHRRGAGAEAMANYERSARVSVDQASRAMRLRRATLAALDALLLDDALRLADEAAANGDVEAADLAIEAVERRDGASAALERAELASPAIRADLLLTSGRLDQARAAIAEAALDGDGGLVAAVRAALAGTWLPTEPAPPIDRVSAIGRRAHRRWLRVGAEAGISPISRAGIDELLAASIAAERVGRRDEAVVACSGAAALLPDEPSALADAIRSRIADLERAAPDRVLSQLTKAERRVAEAVADGRTNREVADHLFLSVKTVDFHLQSVYRKLGLRSRTELAVRLTRGARR